MRHSQYTANPLNPPYQGDFEDLAPIEIIGKCILISRVYYKSLLESAFSSTGYPFRNELAESILIHPSRTLASRNLFCQ